MTPPQVSGVSLAPVPDVEVLCEQGGAHARSKGGAGVGQVQHGESSSNGGAAGRLYKKAAPLRPAIPPTALPDAAASIKATGDGSKLLPGGEPLQLRAEGKKLQQQRSIALPGTLMNSVDVNPNAGYFHDINDADSLWCAVVLACDQAHGLHALPSTLCSVANKACRRP